MTSIGSCAFLNCSSLKAVDLSNVKTIGDEAFGNCVSVSVFALSENLETIGIRAFYGCKMTEITIPEKVSSIGHSAFSNCSNLKTMYFDANNCTVTAYSNINNFENCNNFTEIIFGENVVSIPANVCYNVTNLQTVTFNSNVTSIGNNAFANCSSISDVHYPGTRSQWDAITIGSNNDSLTKANIHFGKFTVTFKIDSETVSKVFSADESVVVPTEDEYSISGYEIVGWKDAKGNEVTFPFTMPDSDIEFTAVLKPLSYNVTIDINGTKFDFADKKTGDVINVPDAGSYDITGYEITGWTDSEGNKVTFPYTVSDKSVTITADLEPLSYTVTFNVYSETIAKTVKYGEPIEVPEKNAVEGCEIIGWDKIIPNTMPAENLTFTAIVNVERIDDNSGICADFDGDCFAEKDVQLKVTEETGTNTNGGLYLIDQANPYKMMNTYNISMVVGQSNSEATFNSGKKCTIKMPVPDFVTDVESLVIIHPLKGADEVFSKKNGNLTIEDGYFKFEVGSFSPFIIAEVTDETTSISINRVNGEKVLKYGEQLKLTAIVENMPENAMIEWYINGKAVGEGETYTTPVAESDFTVEVKIVDEEGEVLHDVENEEIADSQTVTVKAGFFQKLISFFKNLFGISRIVEQAFGFRFVA